MTREEETKVLTRCTIKDLPYYFKELYCSYCNGVGRISRPELEGNCKRYEHWLREEKND